jgi:hypothetical protein
VVDALSHPWLTRASLDGEDKPLEKTVVQRLQRFATLGHLKQVVLSLIVEEVTKERGTFTSPSLEMVDKVKEIFARLDTDKSGDLDFAELTVGLAQEGYNITPDELRQLFQRVDTNQVRELSLRGDGYDERIPLPLLSYGSLPLTHEHSVIPLSFCLLTLFRFRPLPP